MKMELAVHELAETVLTKVNDTDLMLGVLRAGKILASQDSTREDIAGVEQKTLNEMPKSLDRSRIGNHHVEVAK